MLDTKKVLFVTEDKKIGITNSDGDILLMIDPSQSLYDIRDVKITSGDTKFVKTLFWFFNYNDSGLCIKRPDLYGDQLKRADLIDDDLNLADLPLGSIIRRQKIRSYIVGDSMKRLPKSILEVLEQ